MFSMSLPSLVISFLSNITQCIALSLFSLRETPSTLSGTAKSSSKCSEGQETSWESRITHGEVHLHWIPSRIQSLEVLLSRQQEGGHFRKS